MYGAKKAHVSLTIKYVLALKQTFIMQDAINTFACYNTWTFCNKT